MLGHDRAKALQDLTDGLVELGLPGIAGNDLVEDRDEALVQVGHAISPFGRCKGSDTIRTGVRRSSWRPTVWHDEWCDPASGR
ncbi:hypothetical protein GCM10027063_31420 [Promicromonospora xylanilytica]